MMGQRLDDEDGEMLGRYLPDWKLGLEELRTPDLYKALGAEFLGTLLFLYFNTANLIYAQSPDLLEWDTLKVAANFGFTLFVAIQIAAPISGGHLNPAVSLAKFLRADMSLLRWVLYTAFQLAGACAGSGIVHAYQQQLYGAEGGGCNGVNPLLVSQIGEEAVGIGCAAELIGTFFLVLTVLVMTDPAAVASSPSSAALTPFTVGMSVFVIHMSLVPITGCGVNPARSFGPAAVNGCWENQWIYWVGPYCGAILAVFAHQLLYRNTYMKAVSDFPEGEIITTPKPGESDPKLSFKLPQDSIAA
jgi:MIP family channel proteins